jgi:hypothetical protein
MKYAVHEDVKDLVKLDANRPLGRSKCTRENNIENDPKEIMGRGNVCLNKCGAVANTAMKL